MPKELLQEIARRRRRVALIKNVVDGRDLSQESENSPSGPDEADSIHSMSSISASSTGPNSGLSDGPVLDKAYVSGSRPSIPAKLPENPTSSFSAISGQWEGKPVGVVLPPESVEFNLNSSEVENESRLSAKLDGDHAYSEKDQAILSSDNKSSVHLDSAVKAEEMNTVTDSLSMAFETYTPKTDMEQPMFENLLDSMNEFTPEDKKPVAGDNVMNVILVAAECSPFSKTGGLGDVAGSLPKALARRGHRVI